MCITKQYTNDKHCYTAHRIHALSGLSGTVVHSVRPLPWWLPEVCTWPWGSAVRLCHAVSNQCNTRWDEKTLRPQASMRIIKVSAMANRNGNDVVHDNIHTKSNQLSTVNYFRPQMCCIFAHQTPHTRSWSPLQHKLYKQHTHENTCTQHIQLTHLVSPPHNCPKFHTQQLFPAMCPQLTDERYQELPEPGRNCLVGSAPGSDCL